jgi:hypothetical protein
MSRNLTRVLMAVLVLNAFVVASTMLWPNTAHSTGSNAGVAAVDFNYAFNSIAAAQRPAAAPAMMAAVNFDKTFANFSTPHRISTPPNRERLRNIGWQRILGS